MKKLIVAILAFILAIGTMPISAAACSVPYDPGMGDC